MSDIVTLDELKLYLGDAPASADDELLQALLDNVEAMYERDTLHELGFYTAAATGRTEIKEGTGSKSLWLDYPVDVLTSVTLGYDSSEVLNLADRTVIYYSTGSRKLTRTDGGWFGDVGQAGYVEVVYDHLGNLPEDAKLPIMEVVASLYRNRSAEGMKSETLGAFYSYTKDDAQASAATNVNWQASVALNRQMVIA
jgi:hypothetical protein